MENDTQARDKTYSVQRLVRYLIAILRSLRSYESDMGGWKQRIQWEIGFADGELGLPRRITIYDHPYEHGYYCAAKFNR